MSSSPHFKADSNGTVQKVGDKFIVKPRALDIVWGGDSRYWRIPDKSKPGDPAELLQVCWLEMSGSIDLNLLDKGKEYTVSFKVSMKPDAFGWADSPVYLMAKPGRSKYHWKNADLSANKSGNPFYVPMDPLLKFVVPPDGTPSDKLLFGMYEIWKGRWKGGLLVHEVIIQPWTA